MRKKLENRIKEGREGWREGGKKAYLGDVCLGQAQLAVHGEDDGEDGPLGGGVHARILWWRMMVREGEGG